MRLAMCFSVMLLVTSPVFAQKDGGQLPDPPQNSRQRATNWFLDTFGRIAAKPAKPKLNQSEPKLRRQIDETQRKLKQEEQRLRNELEKFDKMREAAIKKADFKAISKVEKLQQQAIERYEKRIKHLLSDGHHDQASRTDVGISKPKDKQRRKPSAAPKKPKRRLRIWPFN